MSEFENLLERATTMEIINVISVGSLPQNVTIIVTEGSSGADGVHVSFPNEGVPLDTEKTARMRQNY